MQMTSWWRPVAQLLVVLGLLAVPTLALAQTSVIVLGVRSAEGDDEFARNLTGALRRAAEQVPGLQIVDRDVSLAQIMIVMGCDDPDAACMQQVATQLGVQRVVYGTTRRTTATTNYNYAIALFSFSAATNEIDQQLTATVTRARSDIDDLRAPARDWMSVLAGLPQVGSVTVTSNVEGAQVLVDGAELGVVAGGTFVAGDLTAGGHLVEVQAEGHTGFRQRVTVVIGETVPLEANLPEGDGIIGPDAPPGGETGSSFNLGLWAGVGSAVLGAVFVGLTAYAWAELDSVNSDPSWLAYRDAAAAPGQPGGVEDICVPAGQGVHYDGTPAGTPAIVKSLCGTADTMEVLQYVFLTLGVVGLGAGAFLIATSGGGDDDASGDVAPTAGTVSLRPVFGTNHGGFEARLTF
jgi:TolB-like protein